MEPSALRLPPGVRDFLPRAAARRRELAERLLTVFEAWGYARIITPAYECADVLERGLGADARAAAIRFVEPASGEVVALRPDITPQIARVVASRMPELPGPVRLCYEGAVTRLVAGVGQREILQAGIELVDLAEPYGDAEVIAVVAASLAAVGLPERHLDLGHVAPVEAVLAAAPAEDVRHELRTALGRKDRRGVARHAAALPPAERALADALVDLWGPAGEVLARAKRLPWPAPARRALDDLERVIATYRAIAGDDALGDDALGVDLGDLRGFGYYTGMRLAGYVGGAPEAVILGGRYDSLLARYGRAATATGFSIDIEAVALAQRALGVPVARRGIAVALLGAPDATAALARALRAAGARVSTAPASEQPAAYLRGAGLDVAVVAAGDALAWPDETSTPAAAELAQAIAGDAQPLLTLISARAP
ncbi:MAG: ATP phosphoribosyltransferase regulatory subunit [Kofleriaceae bacterium]